MTESPLIVGLGELLWDCFPDSRRPGGAPANVAFQAGQLQTRGVVCSRVGTDPLGDELLEFLTERKLETRYIQRDAEHATGTVIVDLVDPAHPQYTITPDVAWDYLDVTPETETLMKQASAVCFGTLAQRSPQARDAILRCLAATSENCLLVYDVNLRQDYYDRLWIERSLQMADVVKLNEDEAATFTGLLGLKDLLPAEFAGELRRRFDLELVCLTRGAKGCSLYADDGAATVPGIKVESPDAVGAGDAFTAGLIVARLRGWGLSPSAKFANQVGALVAGRAGAMPDLRTEFAELLMEYGEEME